MNIELFTEADFSDIIKFLEALAHSTPHFYGDLSK